MIAGNPPSFKKRKVRGGLPAVMGALVAQFHPDGPNIQHLFESVCTHQLECPAATSKSRT